MHLSKEIRVQKGATLLILPGTTVLFAASKNGQDGAKSRLIVHGTLVAQGTPDKPIRFTSDAAQPAPKDWGGIIFERANERTSRLRHCRIEYAMEGIRGITSKLLAEDTKLAHNDVGLVAYREFVGGLLRCTVSENRVGLFFYQSSALRVENSLIEDNSEVGINCVFSSSPQILGNEITGSGRAGIFCIQGSSPLIRANTIRENTQGIHVELQSRPMIYHNDIIENETGIWAEKLVFPEVIFNVIYDNEVGIYCNYSAYPQIHGNSIFNNGKFALVLGDNMSIKMEKLIPFRDMGRHFDALPGTPRPVPSQSKKFAPFKGSDEGIVDARGNWWGENATVEMLESGEEGNASVIEDFFDKPDTWYKDKTYRRDRVVFTPVEEAMIKEAGRPETSYGGIRGKVIYGGIPFAGARVHAYRGPEGDFRGEGFSYSSPTGRDGSFSLTLAPGSYYLVAKVPDPPFPHAEPGEGEYFGYYGGNPVTVLPGAEAESNIQVVRRRVRTVTVEEGRAGAILNGIVEGPGGPLEGASVHVYSDASRHFRGPGLFGPQGAVIGGTDTEGRFAIDLPAGRYYLVASKRKGGGFLGPLKPGDLHGWYDGNPLTVGAGTKVSAVLQVVEKLRETTLPSPAGVGTTSITGTIHDPSGKVPPGVYAYATKDPSFMIGAMPPYRSRPVDENGFYIIDLPEGGTYYVGARSGYGGPPLPGEWHGFLGRDTPDPVAVETGKIREKVDFTVRKME